MSEYSEKAMLLLSNYAYVDASLEEGTIREVLDRYRDKNGEFTEESVSRTDATGGLDNKNKVILFKQMDEYIKEHPEFGELSKARSINEGGIRGICFTDPGDANPIVAFRGTGGSPEAWSDDMVGGVLPETVMMKTAADFVKYECGSYKNITVTGHSKGGNLSAYVTMQCQDQINKCVSFDGQGFNDAFIKENADKIAACKSKIKSISAYNDYVNIQLNSVAGSNIYVDNKAHGVNAHSSVALLTSNEYDEHGNIISYKKQSGVAVTLKKMSDEMVSHLSKQPIENSVSTAVVIGCFVSSVLSVDSVGEAAVLTTKTVSDITAAFNDKISDVIKEMFPEKTTIRFQSEFISERLIQNTLDMLDIARQRLVGTKNEINQITGEIDYSIASKIYVDISLSRVCDRLEKITENLRFMHNELELITAKYEQKDRLIASNL